jgi:predicted RND superfamily exporter protein
MDDAMIKGTIAGMFSFDSAPLEAAVGGVVTARDMALVTANMTPTGPVAGPLMTLLSDPQFLTGNYTFMGQPVDGPTMVEVALGNLGTIEIVLAGFTGFELQPEVLANQIFGMSAGLKIVMSKDFDPTLAQPRAKATLLVVQQNGSIGSDVILESQYDIEDMAEKVEDENPGEVEFMIMGGEILFDKINTSSMTTLGTLMMLAVVLIIVILGMVYRSLSDTALTLAALMIVITWTFGLGVVLGYTFNPLTTAVPILLVGLSVDYGIHLTMRNRYEKRRKSLNAATIATIGSVGMALLLATVTTVFSFMSNILSSLSVMRQFGMLTAMGIISAFIIMNTFVPSVRLLWDRRRERKGLRRGSSSGTRNGPARKNALVKFVELGAHAAARFGTLIVVGSIIISALAFFSVAQLDSEFNFTDFIPEDLPEAKTIDYLFTNFNFSSSSSVVLVEGDVATASVLQAVDRTQQKMDNDRDVVKIGDTADVRSPLTVAHKYSLPSSPDYIPELGDLFSSSDVDGDGIPDENVKALFLALARNPNSGRDLASVLHMDDDGEFDAAIIRIGIHETSDGGDMATTELNDDAIPLEKLEDSGDLESAIVTQGPVLQYSVVTEMNEAGLKSVVATIIASAILLTFAYWVVFRTVVVGLLTTIPIILVMGWVFGSMFLLNIPLNVITVTVAALTVGLGITYAIHISHRFLEDVKKEPWKAAMCTTVGHTGAALFGAAATTIGGFGILMFSILPPMAQFGIVTALSIFFSFFASVFVLPSFLAIWARWKFGDDAGEICDPGDAPLDEKPGQNEGVEEE